MIADLNKDVRLALGKWIEGDYDIIDVMERLQKVHGHISPCGQFGVRRCANWEAFIITPLASGCALDIVLSYKLNLHEAQELAQAISSITDWNALAPGDEKIAAVREQVVATLLKMFPGRNAK